MSGTETAAMGKVERRQERQRDMIVAALQAGATKLEACECAGVSRATYYRWFGECTAFRETASEARGALRMETLNELRQQAFGRYVEEVAVQDGPRGEVTTRRRRWKNGSIAAMKLWLKRLDEDDLFEVGPMSGVEADEEVASDDAGGEEESTCEEASGEVKVEGTGDAEGVDAGAETSAEKLEKVSQFEADAVSQTGRGMGMKPVRECRASRRKAERDAKKAAKRGGKG